MIMIVRIVIKYQDDCRMNDYDSCDVILIITTDTIMIKMIIEMQ